MIKRAVIFLAVSFAAFGQTRSRLAEYALVLQDEPVARVVPTRAALRGPDGEAHARRIRSAQTLVMSALRDRGVAVTGATQTLVNAVLVSTTREIAAELQNLPGVKYVVRAPKVRPSLDRAASAANVSAAWTALGGSAQAGAGIKIGIIDSGIDLTHPGFQDPASTAPAGFPKGNTAYTNGKVIVARSYIAKDLAPGFTSHDRSTIDPATISQPDDDTPRDHIGHGTALAMIAAGAANTDRANGITLQGIAPKAYIGNYKIFGSPGINDFSSFAAVNDALTDAVADGMDVVTLSMNEGDPPFYAPLDVENEPPCSGQCDVYAQAVEAAVAKGLVVVVAAGNSGADGKHGPTWVTVHFPGTAPSAITVGALTNTRVMYQTIRTDNAQNIRARFGNGPQLQTPLRGTLKDAGSACNALPGGSLAGAVALIQRGDCFIDQKINNAQQAGAIAAIVVQASGDDITSAPLPATTTGIPAALVGVSDGGTLKDYVGVVTLDPAYTSTEASGGTVWAASSRGPSVGDFGITKTNVIKPEIAAVGVNIYTAAQRLDPSGDAYNATGYTSVTGTSYATAVVAGAAALVKQKNPQFTPAQIKSALVNTANPDVQDNGAQASVRSVGAGKLDAGAAVAATITASPATISFGAVAAASLPINRTLTLTNSGTASAALTFSVQQRFPDSNATVSVSTTSITLGAGATNNVTVTLRGTRPNPGVYEGAITIAGGGQTIRVPYLYLVGDNTPYDVYPIGNGNFLGGTSDTGWEIDLRVVDQYGVPVVGAPVRFTAVSGGGKVSAGDDRTFNLGIAAALVDLSANPGEHIFRGTAGGPAGPSVDFSGIARPYPVIKSGGVANAAPNGTGIAPGAYVSLYGTTFTEGATQIESTPFLPVTLSNVSVTFDADGVSLPGRLHFVSPGQVNAQLPWEFQGKPSVKVKVWSDYLAGDVMTVPLAQYAPGVFATTDANYVRISSANPAKRDGRIIVFANGLGPVANQPASGEPTTGLSTTTATPSVTIGGKAAVVEFSGLTPGAVGLYQLNLRLAPDTPAGDQPMVISIGGVSSGPSTLPVQ